MIGPSGGGRIGAPRLALSEPQLRLVLHVTILACRMARPAVLAHRAAGAKVDENTISLFVMQRIVAIQHRWEIEGFEFTREAILDSALGSRPKVLGRIAASAQALPTGMSARVLKAFPGSTTLQPYARTYRHATVVEGLVPRNGTSPVRLIHALIRMHA